jgi:hypothetical protein
MNDRAAKMLGVRGGFDSLDPEMGLVPGLRKWVDGGIECRGEVVYWRPAPPHADDAPARSFERLAGELHPPIPLRCITGTNETNGVFRFHRIRPEETWPADDLDGYDEAALVVLDFHPRPDSSASNI